MNNTNGEEEETEQSTQSYFSDLYKSLKDTARTAKFFVELAALAVVVVYTCETCRTNNLTQQALDNSAKQFRIQGRPYIGPLPRQTGIVHIPKPGKGTVPILPGLENGGDVPVPEMLLGNGTFRMALGVDIKNYGKSPAVNVISTPSKIIVGLAAEARERVSKYIPDYSDTPSSPLMMDEVHTVPEGPSSDIPIVTTAENILLANGTWEAYVVGAVRYQDIFSPAIPPYETIYCFKLHPSGMPFSGCKFKETTIR